MLQRLTSSMADMQHVNSLVLDREENPIHVRLSAIEHMANLKRENCALRSEWATRWKFGERPDGVL